MTENHHPFPLCLEMEDGPVQDLDADVDLGLEVRQRQFRVAGCQVVLQGEGLVNMDELERLEIGEVHELVLLLIADEFMERATLFVDPHRVGIGVAGYSEQLSDSGRYRCRLVFVGDPGGKELATTGDQRRGPQEHGKIDELPLAVGGGETTGYGSVLRVGIFRRRESQRVSGTGHPEEPMAAQGIPWYGLPFWRFIIALFAAYWTPVSASASSPTR